jgi:hypothetical protein
MKRQIFIIAGALLCSIQSFSQLRVYSNGNVGVKSTQTTSTIPLSVGNKTYGSYYSFNMSSTYPFSSDKYNIGLEGFALRSTAGSTGRAIGVRGVAGNCTSGYNYGVLGALQGTYGGAGVFGSDSEVLGYDTGGKYAGFFHGDIKTTGATKIYLTNPHENNMTNTSAIQSALSIINALQTLQGSAVINTPDLDTMLVRGGEEEGQRVIVNHYAFVPGSIATLYPGLVQQDAAGDYYVNNTELIPVLVAAIQQLYAMVSSSAMANPQDMEGGTDGLAAAPVRQDAADGCRLWQNSPNPFSSSTVIRYSVPEGAGDAWLCLFDMKGTLLRQIRLDAASGNVTLNGGELQPGMYFYSLIAGGKEVDTKKMILSR